MEETKKSMEDIFQQLKKFESRLYIKEYCEIIEEGLTAHFSILVWRIPWTEEPGVAESDMTEVTEHVELLIFLGVIMVLWL